MLPLLASIVPHVVCNMNQSHYSDCAIVGFGKSFTDVKPIPVSVFFSPGRGNPGFPPRAKSVFVHFVSEEGLFAAIYGLFR